MLKSFFGSVSSRRHRQSPMVAAQVSPLERRELLDGTTGYGSYDPYGTSSSGSDSGSASSSSGYSDPYADGSMSGSSSGSTSGSGSSSGGTPASPSNPPPTTGSITLRPNVSSASNNLNVSKETGDDPGTPFIRTHDLFTNANFDVDFVYSGSSPRIEYTATNGDTTLSWTGLGWGQGASVPVGSGAGVTLTAELFDDYGRLVDSDTCTIGVVTFSLTGRSVLAEADITEAKVQSEAENYLRAMAAAPIADLRGDLLQLATQMDKADPRADLWQSQLPLQFDNMVANCLDSIVAESRVLISTGFEALDSGMAVRIAVSNPYYAEALEFRNLTIGAIRDWKRQFPLLSAIQLEAPSRASFVAGMLESCADGNVADLPEIMERSASRFGLSVPFSWTDANNNRIEGKVGASTFVLQNPQGQNSRVYDIKSGISAKQYESDVLIKSFFINAYFRESQGIVLPDEGWNIQTGIDIRF